MSGNFRFALAPLILVAGLHAQTKTCGDFLAGLHKKPRNLEFVSCTSQPEAQGKPLKAEYRVKGENAAAVENYLVQNFHMKRLKKSCCQWDGPAGSYNHAGELFQVRMTSDEDTATVAAATRADWRKLPYFHVEVTLDTEAP
jgi:hypothetical protein